MSFFSNLAKLNLAETVNTNSLVWKPEVLGSRDFEYMKPVNPTNSAKPLAEQLLPVAQNTSPINSATEKKKDFLVIGGIAILAVVLIYLFLQK